MDLSGPKGVLSPSPITAQCVCLPDLVFNPAVHWKNDDFCVAQLKAWWRTSTLQISHKHGWLLAASTALVGPSAAVRKDNFVESRTCHRCGGTPLPWDHPLLLGLPHPGQESFPHIRR